LPNFDSINSNTSIKKKMTVETDTVKNSKESPTKIKRKRASRSSSSGSSSSGTTSSSSASSRSSSSSSNSSSSTSRSSSAASSPEKKSDRNSAKATNNNKPSTKKSLEHGATDDKQNVTATNQSRRSVSPVSSRRQEKEKEKEATKIYIGKLSLNVNKDHLAEIFGTFGEIKEIDLPAHRIHSRLHRGFAHIEYVAANGAEQACKYMEGGQIDGKEIVCVLVHGQPPHLSNDRNRREPSPYRRRRRSPLPPTRHYPPQRRMGDRDRGRYNDRRGGYSPPSRNYRRGQSPPPSSRRTGAGGNTAESPKKKERRYSRSSSSESK
jgi:RNA-binding protein with serine-rich domain 1